MDAPRHRVGDVRPPRGRGCGRDSRLPRAGDEIIGTWLLGGAREGDALRHHTLGPLGRRRAGAVMDREHHVAPYRRGRSEEHTSELQSLMRISYAVFCLKKKQQHTMKKNKCTR